MLTNPGRVAVVNLGRVVRLVFARYLPTKAALEELVPAPMKIAVLLTKSVCVHHECMFYHLYPSYILFNNQLQICS